jgi:LmbE family N-acetylglucosaminyl deacetylase
LDAVAPTIGGVTAFILTTPFPLAQQRILILAPHPDDESLATGGLIQRALQEGARVQVVFISDGENNPWPQRFLERRWEIGESERSRWGERRRQEAVAALRRLGVPKDHAHFLGLPDQGTTSSLLKAREVVIGAIVRALTSWRPTLLVAPSPHDVHPDHNALAVLVHLALARWGGGPEFRLVHYLVHTRKQRLPAPRWALQLSADERANKRAAILEHASQMALSSKRFLAYARPVEYFYPPEATDPLHPIRHVGVEDGALTICVQPMGVPAVRSELLIAFEDPFRGSIRWRVPVHFRSGVVRISDAITGRLLRNATVRRIDRVLEFRLPISGMQPGQSIALKFNRQLAFYDEAGWYEHALPARDSHAASVKPPAWEMVAARDWVTRQIQAAAV